MFLSTYDLVMQFASMFTLNLVSIFVLTYFIFYKRHHDKMGFITYTLFGIFLFSVVFFLIRNDSVISLGFAIFGILSLIRLRSETFNKLETTYFFVTMSVALLNGMIGPSNFVVMIVINAILLALVWIFDHPDLFQHSHQKVLFKLDSIPPTLFAEPETTKQHLAEVLNVDVVDYSIVEVDSVKDSSQLRVTYRK